MNGLLKTQLNRCHTDFLRANPRRKPLWQEKQLIVLVPFRKYLYGLRKSDYIDANCTTMHLGGFKYDIAFMAIDEALYASHMKDFWDELNKDMEKRREGLCIIDKNPDGTDKLCPDPTEEELRIKILAHFDKENPRYAKIIRLSLEGKSIDDKKIILGASARF